MNVLLLSNSAPNYFQFFNALAKALHQDGAEVIVAVDSKFSRLENKIDKLGFTVYEFAEFAKVHRTSAEILKKYQKYNLNYALLSDFERAETYGVWGNIDVQFYDHLKSALLAFYEKIWEQHSIQLVVYENVSNAFAYFALFVAKENGARYCGIGGSRLPGRFSVTDDPLQDTLVARHFAQIHQNRNSVPEDLAILIRDYLDNIENIVPDYMMFNGSDQVGLFRRYMRIDRISKVKSLLRHAFDKRNMAFQIGNPLLTHFNLFIRNVKRRIKLGRLRNFYDEETPSERFLLYPLHFHPESSTSVLAGTYLDEYEVIRNIAFSLPEGMRLYVKDHKSAWGYPSMEFYRRLKRLPNVRVLKPSANTKQLIKRAEAVITLTSTVGYEALLLGKQVFLFGRVFYEFHKGVCRITNPAELRLLFEENLGNMESWDDRYNFDFVAAYYKATFPGTLNLTLKGEAAISTAEQVHSSLKKSGYLESSVVSC